MPKGQTTQDFSNYTEQFKRTGNYVRSLINLGIVTVLVRAFGPEYERQVLDIVASACVAVIVSFLVFIFFAGTSLKRRRKTLRWSFGSLPIAFVLYFGLYSEFTGLDSSGDRYIKGLRYTSAILDYKDLIAKKKQAGEAVDEIFTDDRLVASFENNPRNVWEPSTVDRVSGLVHITWLLFVASISFFTSNVMLLLPVDNPKQERGTKP